MSNNSSKYLLSEAEASQEASDAGQERGQKAVAETSKERGEGGNETGKESTEETNEAGKNVGKETEDRVEDRGKLRADAKDGQESLDGEEQLRDQGNNEGEDLVEVGLGDVEASSVEDLLKNVGELELDVLELIGGSIGGGILGHGAILDLRDGGVDVGSVLLEARETRLEDGDQVSTGLDATLDRGLGSTVDNLAEAKVTEKKVLEFVNGVRDSVTGSRSAGGGKSRESQSGEGEECGLHCEDVV